MNEKELVEKLKSEGFSNVYIWEDRPETYYPDHQHEKFSAHIILDVEKYRHSCEIVLGCSNHIHIEASEESDNAWSPAGAPASSRSAR